MKKQVLLFTILSSLLLISGCDSDKTVQEPKEEITTGFLTSTYTHQDENMSMKIIVNNIDKSGNVEVQYYVSDAQEGYFSMDEGIYTTNEAAELENGGFFTIVFCSIYWQVFKDLDNAENFSNELQEQNPDTITIKDEQTNEEKEMSELLKGFRATKFSLTFIDKEDSSTILECYNTGLEQEDLKYKAYNTTTQRELEIGEEALWGDSFGTLEDEEAIEDTVEEERPEYASCVSLGCDDKHIAIGDRSTNEWFYCDCFGAASIATEDRTCFSSIDVAEAVGYYQAWGCE